MKRVELGVHTNMSDTIGVNLPKDYIHIALMDGMSAIAITDRSSTQAFPEAYKAVNETGGIKLIYGVELDYQKNGEIYYLSILAKNRQGLRTVYQLLSNAYIKSFDMRPMLSLAELEKHRENLLRAAPGVIFYWLFLEWNLLVGLAFRPQCLHSLLGG